MLESGTGVTRDVPLAIKYYRKAAAQGIEDAKKAVLRLGGRL
jgi:TPR repeat protein